MSQVEGEDDPVSVWAGIGEWKDRRASRIVEVYILNSGIVSFSIVWG